MNQDIIKAFQKSNHRFITKIIREWYFNTEFTEKWLFNIYGSQLILESVFQRIQDTLGKSKKKVAFVYCYQQYFKDMDVCRIICDKLSYTN